MRSSGSRRAQLALFTLIGLAALAAVLLVAAGNSGDSGGLRLFSKRITQPGRAGAAAPVGSDQTGLPSRLADSVEAFTKDHGDPPDATYGRIRIPTISVNAPISYRAVSGAVMPEPSGPTDVAYYDMAAFPGMGGAPGAGGNAIFGGHVDLRRAIDYAGGVEYQGPAVFWALGELRQGDVIEVDYRGTTHRYIVTAVNELDATHGDWGAIWSDDVSRDTITLFTCGGTFDPGLHEYSTRMIVRAEAG